MLHFQAYDDTSRTILREPLGGIFFLLKAAHVTFRRDQTMRLRYRNARTSRRAGVGAGRKQKRNSSSVKKKKKGGGGGDHSRLLSKLCYAFRVLNRKLLSQNNVKYDKPLCSISFSWGVGGGDGK